MFESLCIQSCFLHSGCWSLIGSCNRIWESQLWKCSEYATTKSKSSKWQILCPWQSLARFHQTNPLDLELNQTWSTALLCRDHHSAQSWPGLPQAQSWPGLPQASKLRTEVTVILTGTVFCSLETTVYLQKTMSLIFFLIFILQHANLD